MISVSFFETIFKIIFSPVDFFYLINFETSNSEKLSH